MVPGEYALLPTRGGTDTEIRKIERTYAGVVYLEGWSGRTRIAKEQVLATFADREAAARAAAEIRAAVQRVLETFNG